MYALILRPAVVFSVCDAAIWRWLCRFGVCCLGLVVRGYF